MLQIVSISNNPCARKYSVRFLMPENGIPELTKITRTIASTHSNGLALKYIPVVFCFAIQLDNVYAMCFSIHFCQPRGISKWAWFMPRGH